MAGTAPPVMLMICRLAWGPSVKREKGIEIEMPCCRIKFELNNRKKTSRNARSTNDTSTSQPKLKFIVRLSFMRRCRFVDLEQSPVEISNCASDRNATSG